MGAEQDTVVDGMIWIPGGEFAMGSEDFYPEERPVRRVAVDGVWMAPHPVTNDEFGVFVEATGYVTLAELSPDPALYPGAPQENLVPGSMVFTPPPGPVDLRDPTQWWRWTPGADWRHPAGPGSSVEGIGNHPVVHVALSDVQAYCEWVGATLPTEAEWEHAARGGLDCATFTWGDDDPQDRAPLANTWQGRFPWENTCVDGWLRTSPVESFPPNGYGLYDVSGNVWEWTDDWYSAEPGAGASPCCIPRNPRGGAEEDSRDPAQPQFPIPRKVVKGGSHLCARNYCFRYRPAARQPQPVDTGMSHVGFRCVVRPAAGGVPTRMEQP